MDFYMRLPRNHREFVLFLLIVSLISVNLIAPLISMFELGFSFEVWQNTLRVLPFIWLAVVSLVILTQKTSRQAQGPDRASKRQFSVADHDQYLMQRLFDVVFHDFDRSLDR